MGKDAPLIFTGEVIIKLTKEELDEEEYEETYKNSGYADLGRDTCTGY